MIFMVFWKTAVLLNVKKQSLERLNSSKPQQKAKTYWCIFFNYYFPDNFWGNVLPTE